MDFKECVSQIDNGLKNVELFEYFSEKVIREILIVSFKEIVSNIENIENLQKENLANIERIKITIGLFKDVVILYPLTENIKNFVLSYCDLIFNWNKILNNNEISRDISLIQRMIVLHFNTLELLSVIKILTNNAKKYEDFKPITFDISRQFFEKLDSFQLEE